MAVTIFLTVIMCVLLFLMIWSAAFFLPWKRLMDFFPEDIKEKAIDHKPPFKSAPIIGWICMILLLAVAHRGEVPDNLKFEQADACKLQYADDSFDVVIIANALHIIPEPEKALAEIRRVLKKDGILIAPNFIHDNKNRISGAFSKALSAAGVKFEAKWDADGFIAFLARNGFEVKHSKQLNSTIPMVYVEAVQNY